MRRTTYGIAYLNQEDKDMKSVVYALIDPRTDTIKYVGRTVECLDRRVSRHIREATSAKAPSTRKNNWLKHLQRNRLSVIVAAIEIQADPGRLSAAEMFHISSIRAAGGELLNATNGGEGSIGFRHNDETKVRMKQIHRRIDTTLDARIANSRRQGGRPVVDHNGTHFDTQAEAARAHNLDRKSVHHLLYGRLFAMKGVRLRYEGEDFPLVRKNNKAVVDDQGNVYASIKEAARATGCSYSSVYAVIKGRLKRVKGRHFRYL